MRHGGQILVDALKANGVTRVFSVPGESFLAALDGLHDSGIHNIVCRQEGGAAMMADASGKLTGRPGVAFVTRGPGATNASAGVHVARQDSTPMILFVGQIARSDQDREAFQEVDYRAMFAPLAKWVAQIDQTDRIAEYVTRAFHIAMSGRPGPVVLALPEDMLSDSAAIPDLPAARPALPHVAPDSITALTNALRGAQRPLVVAGGGLWSQRAADDLARFAAAWDLPVTVPFRRQGHMDNTLPHYIGDLGVGMSPALGKALQQADVIVSLGSRLGDTLTDGFALMDPVRPHARIIQVHPDPDQIGKLWTPDPGLVADPRAVVAALAETTTPDTPWAAWRQDLRRAFEDWQAPRTTPGDVRMEQIIGWLAANLPDETIVTNGAGNYAAFLHRYYRWRQYGTQLAPTSGSMGYGLPAAIAASLAHPDRTVLCMAGDGCLQMTVNELSTAAQYGATPIVIVANNGRYGTIRMHQERHFPGRVSGTDLFNPDFAALARAYGGHGERVENDADFPAAFERAQASGRLAIIELRLDPEALTTGVTLSQIRDAAMRAKE
ncbi:MAG: thiamine pyrophosphate-binding protein [Paracoccus sp. (in: a-proteobacteria)]|nr:thiamine pyrophosphate-binding protein [Paracoccus sp. (in: a-proteobacteria)]